MQLEQYQKAQRLFMERANLEREFELWGREVREPSDLGYKQSWNKGHVVDFKNSIPEEDFYAFRKQQMDRISARLEEIQKEFAAI